MWLSVGRAAQASRYLGQAAFGWVQAMLEMARVDGSMSTFYLVHSFLAELTIGLLVRQPSTAVLHRYFDKSVLACPSPCTAIVCGRNLQHATWNQKA
jgi:hypothetical protein